MILKDTNATVEITNSQKAGDSSDRVKTVSECGYYIKNGKYYILYNEVQEDGKISSQIKVDGDTVHVRRTGAYASDMVYKKNNAHCFVYHMPYGDMDMRAETTNVSVSLGENGGTVHIEYVLHIQNELYYNDMTIIVKK